MERVQIAIICLFQEKKLTNKINIKKIFSPSEPVWKTFEDIEYTDQLSDLWDDPEIQLVVITTPSQFHYEYGKMALEHGKNVLVEKPFAETSKEAEELFALAKEKVYLSNVTKTDGSILTS